ncbi:diacylglycerol/lipid kinase family protein [Litchfieldia alkalitelluris]|uniref:diacylglycerol/lipid kinase family protein n=1 Tax=Litchfieldia alkalitelluris TaxID=304268 RepID=UPI0014731857|nr:diacylglycerol kinase family protein [Litchfieldia alkalitelluris]
MKKYFFIVNRFAAGGKSLKVWEKIKQQLEEQQIQFRTFFTNTDRHAEELAKQIANIHHEHIEAIIAVGGDGTIHEVVNGLVNYPNIKVGYIPSGSANDFSRGFQIPRSPLHALGTILSKTQKVSKIDVGKIKLDERSRHFYFVNSVGVGFDAEVSKIVNQSKMKKYLNKLHLSSFIYIGALVSQLFNYKVSNVHLTIDNQDFHYEKVWFVTVSNQRFYGGGMKISPKANPFDGLLNITVIHCLSPLQILLLFSTVFIGKHTLIKGVDSHIGKEIKIVPDRKLPLHADGEIIG